MGRYTRMGTLAYAGLVAVSALLPASTCAPQSGRPDTGAGVFSFRNNFSGIYPRAQPPLLWGSPKSVVWKFPLQRRSNASPVTAGDKVFILDEPFRLICLRAGDGTLLWQRDHSYVEVFGPAWSRARLPSASWLSTYGYTTPTPVSDGQRVWCSFGHGMVVCYDLDGNRKWATPIDATDKVAGLAVSPCLVAGVLVVGGKGADRLCGLHPDTGRKLWQTGEGAQDGSNVPLRLAGRWWLVTSSGLVLEPRSGEVWQRGLLGSALDGLDACQPVNWGPTVVTDGSLAIFHIHFPPDKTRTAFRAVRLGICGYPWPPRTYRSCSPFWASSSVPRM